MCDISITYSTHQPSRRRETTAVHTQWNEQAQIWHSITSRVNDSTKILRERERERKVMKFYNRLQIGSFSLLSWNGFSNRFESWALMLVCDMQGSQVQGGKKKKPPPKNLGVVISTGVHFLQNLPFAIYPRTYFILYLTRFYLKQHYIFLCSISG